jgi:hypothetical protein
MTSVKRAKWERRRMRKEFVTFLEQVHTYGLRFRVWLALRIVFRPKGLEVEDYDAT